MRPHSLIVIVLLALALVLGACGDDDDAPRTGEGAVEPTAIETGPESGCEEVPRPPPKETTAERPDTELDPAKRYRAVVRTNCGDFTIDLDVNGSPRTVASFVSLARQGFYDDTSFHRIVPDFVIQGGDPAGDGSGGPGYSVVEPPPRGRRYEPGVVAMAKTEVDDPGTSGSQFFVVTGPGAGALEAIYAILGRVSAGQETVDRIAALPVGPDESPLEPAVIETIEIDES